MAEVSRVSYTRSMTVPASADVVFPLLCPVREYDWIPHWACDLIYSESGFAELGCVFVTHFEGRGAETWMVTRYEPAGLIEFCRIAGTTRACHIRVDVGDQGDGTCTLKWTYTHTGIDEAGHDWVRGYERSQFDAELDVLDGLLRSYLAS